ncbi:cupin domain-containing protein [Synoicihabitans lomoniglobus]|uniref:Cupin domain-containing protein n=1 Tax=Synoicihabitans lomoniglobus TaxID=2909285 RepID=A0AAE9ZUT9_9BACT|nr:cupin domain-containing protein [Opitutaceae bacterium LMO-M01]WED63449.1 cupin domain-containing protein [Opitutaceae bacterium LMO-M01]
MNKVNLRDIAEETSASPKGTFGAVYQGLSLALGRDETSTDLLKRHPFDVEVVRVPAGKAICPYHSHSAQWEFFHVISGRGSVRHADGVTELGADDAFLFKPGEPHQIRAADEQEIVLFVVADNPIGESCHYPDSGKWLVRSPERRLIRSENLNYFDGEE